MTEFYINRDQNKHSFTPDDDGNLLWDGDFFSLDLELTKMVVITLSTQVVDLLLG